MVVSTDRFPFSPLFKRRYMIICLRIVFGFPLKRTNLDYNHFEFNSLIEYGRYVLSLTIAMAGSAYIVYFNYKIHGTSDIFRVIENNVKGLGLSLMDMLVLQSLPFVNYVSNFTYLHSFKKALKGINEILHQLSKANGNLFSIMKGNDSSSAICNHFPSNHGKKSAIMVVILFGLATGLMTTSWSLFNISNDPQNITVYEIIGLVFAISISVLAYIYTPMACSAEFLVISLISETKEAFDKFHSMIQTRNETTKQKQLNETTSDQRSNALTQRQVYCVNSNSFCLN